MYRSLKAEVGTISLKSFLEKYGDKQKPRLSKAFGGGYWGKLVESCGDTARTFSSEAVSLEAILDDYGKLTRKLGKPAVSADWDYEQLKPTRGGMFDGPHKVRFGQLSQLFVEQRGGHPEWEDVCALLRSKSTPKKTSNVLPLPVARANGKFNGVLHSIRGWTPSERFRTEEGYQENLRSHLERAGFKVRTQKGDSFIDLLVDDEVAVEVKKAPNMAEYDRLFGQIARHCDQYGQVIAVVCDVATADGFNDFNARLDKWLRSGAVIEVVQK